MKYLFKPNPGKVLKSRVFQLVLGIFIVYPAISSIGSTHNVFSLQNKTIIFLNAEQGYKYVSNSSHLQELSMLDISLRMEKDISSFDTLIYQKDYIDYHKKQFRNWSHIDKKFALHQLRLAYLKMDSIAPKVIPDTLYLIRTTGKQEFKSYYTCKNAIVCPSALRLSSTYLPFIRYVRAFTEQIFIHETFHIYSSSHPEIRDELYNIVGFERIDSLYLPLEISEKLIRNPDDKNYFYKISLKDQLTNKINDYTLLILSKYPRWEGYIDFPARLNVLLVYLDSGFVQIKVENGKWTAILDENQQVIVKCIDMFSDFHEKVGLRDDAISPEEIVAHLFTNLIKSKFDDEILKNKTVTNLNILEKIESTLNR